MAKAKSIMFTDDELRTLVWALNNEYHKTVFNNIKNGRLASDKTTERLVELSRKVYGELIRRHN